MQEDKIAITSHFITLTYDPKYVPISSKGFMSLRKRDFQLFIKRLRKNHSVERRVGNKSGVLAGNFIKYFAVGEYGSQRMRPHYHAILFNSTPELIMKSWSIEEVFHPFMMSYKRTVKRRRAIGEVHFGDVQGASVGYVLKYMCKEGKVPMHKNDDRVPEFSLMSKGLGANYLTDAMRRWHKADLLNRTFCNLTDGKKIALPRYYRDKLYTGDERDDIAYAGAIRARDLKIQNYENGVKLYGSVEAYEKALRESIDGASKKMFSSQKKRNKV